MSQSKPEITDPAPFQSQPHENEQLADNDKARQGYMKGHNHVGQIGVPLHGFLSVASALNRTAATVDGPPSSRKAEARAINTGLLMRREAWRGLSTLRNCLQAKKVRSARRSRKPRTTGTLTWHTFERKARSSFSPSACWAASAARRWSAPPRPRLKFQHSTDRRPATNAWWPASSCA